jgi:hypothetical protein
VFLIAFLSVWERDSKSFVAASDGVERGSATVPLGAQSSRLEIAAGSQSGVLFVLPEKLP